VTACSRISTTLDYADADQACDAVFIGGPVALAWSRLDEQARSRSRARFLEAIRTWRHPDRTYRIRRVCHCGCVGAPAETAGVGHNERMPHRITIRD